MLSFYPKMFLISSESDKRNKPYDGVAAEPDTLETGQSNETKKKRVIGWEYVLGGVLVFTLCVLMVVSTLLKFSEFQ